MIIWDDFEGRSDVIQLQSVRICGQFHNHECNIVSLQYTGDPAVVETEGFSERIGAKEGLGGFVSKQRVGEYAL